MIKHGLISNKIIFNLAVFYLIGSSILAQPKGKTPFLARNNIFIETNYVPTDTGYTCYISYRVALDNLIFVMKENKYFGGLTLDFELLNNNQIIARRSSSKSISVSSYDSTLSRVNYLQGVISLDIGKKDYVLNSYVSIANGDENMHLDSLHINQKDIIKDGFLNPISVLSDGSDCGKEFPFQLVNYDNTIPFSPSETDLLIPVADTSISKIDVDISQENKSVLKETIERSIKNNYGFIDCNNKIYFEKNPSNQELKYFYLPNVSSKLIEGPVKITIKADTNKSAEFTMAVLWNDKPRSLMNPELAIKCLAAIENPDKIDTLLSADKEEYSKVLADYWNSKFPDRKHVFNEFEFEYYQRVDYALMVFGTVDKKNGAASDRGIIYIRYGRPDSVKRDFNNSNMAIEIWTYKRLNKEFLFTDKTGLGNYTLGQ